MEQQDRPIIAHTKHGDFTLDQIAGMQPGLGRLMPDVSDRYWILFYAAKGGNWPLARYQANELGGVLALCATARPKYAAQLKAFIEGHLAAIQKAIESRDWAAFERAYQKGIQGANTYHRETGHGEIEWRLPHDPPQHLRLTPADGDSK